MGTAHSVCRPRHNRYKPPLALQEAALELDGEEAKEYITARDCWDFMCNGCKLIKIKSKRRKKRKGKKKFFILDEDLMGFRYSPSHKPKGYKVSLNAIKDVLGGSQILDADRIKKYHRDCQLVIVYERRKVITRMHLVAFSIDAAKKWAFGLQAVLKRKGLLLSKPDPLRDEWLKSAFTKYDADKNGALSLSEVEKLLFSLNINLDSKLLKMLFNEANIQGIQGHKDGTLTKEEFADFFKRISTREEIVDILKSFAENKISMTLEEFKEFLSSQHHIEEVTEDKCKEIINKFEPVEECKGTWRIGLDGLTKYLLSADGDLFDPAYDSVYQDMNQPLSHYFIASSHNTYLMEDQLRGPSSTQAYINALKNGCRCVELDCWDGDDNEPVIYHGYTFTSKILFKDAIRAVHEFAFYSSPYPLILSLENHCSIEQQKVMAKHLVEILEDKLFYDEVDEELTSLPSPESLKWRILIKGKKLTPEQENDGDDLGDVSEDDEAAEIVVDSSMNDVEDFIGMHSKREDKQKEKNKNLKLAKELSRLVNYVRSVKFHSFENALKNNKPYEISSFSESKFLALGESDAEDFIKYNTKFLSRTYPAGIRVDSSNYDPHDAWNLGCQIVALNYQTDGVMMDVYKGKFRDNGGCGYLIKPNYMRDLNWSINPTSKLPSNPAAATYLQIKVISGQQLPKARNSKQKEVIDPYVQIEMSGHPLDTNDKLFCSKTIHNNGFNPVWNDSISFPVNVPELCILRFSVYDSDYGTDDFVGQASIPVKCMRQGYRHIRLLSKQGNDLPNSTLFVHVTMKNS